MQPARPDGAKTSPKIDGQPSPPSAAAVTDDASTRAIADERRSPEVALGIIGRALSRGPSPTRESASSGPVRRSIPHSLSARSSARGRGGGRLSTAPTTTTSIAHRSTEGGCLAALASCSGLVPYLPPIPWGTPEARVESAPPTTEASVTPGPAAAAPPAAKRARNSE